MWRKAFIAIAILGLLGLLAFGQEIKNPDTMIWVTHGPAETLDPHYSYDTASGEIIFNVYENLVRWPYGIVDADEVDLSYSLNPDDLLPMLATEWSVSDDGRTYTFKIREGVKFHAGGTLTPEDVEYSFERGMLQDRDGGPIWMLLEPLTGFSSLRDIAKDALGEDRYKEIGGDLHKLTPDEQAYIYTSYIDPAV